MNENVFLEVKDLVVEYTSGEDVVHAVNGVSFSLEKGKTLALVGETGAGKTTIAKTIMRILPDPPAKIRGGSICLNGENLLEINEQAMRKVRGEKISMVFQDPMTALNPVMKVGDQIAEVIKIHKNISKKEAKMQAETMLEMVGITKERYSEYPHQFSGGMKQRVIIAIALACSPDLLLADEPTTALDVTIQAQVLEMMNELRKKQNTSMIMITHDLGIVANVSDYVAIVYAGEIIEYGSKREIFSNPCHPYTQGLFGAIPNLEQDTRRLANIEGMPPDPTHLPEGCRFHPRCPYATEACKKGSIPMSDIGGSHRLRCLHPNMNGEEKKHAKSD